MGCGSINLITINPMELQILQIVYPFTISPAKQIGPLCLGKGWRYTLSIADIAHFCNLKMYQTSWAVIFRITRLKMLQQKSKRTPISSDALKSIKLQLVVLY